ncbi:hypothetical protein [Streptomyces sp. NBC_00005]|uniref:hypothetical protein n=1 Tax=Streptomyces sp. NBC_00005 TaxID=2903609 RepID=UPI00324355E7
MALRWTGGVEAGEGVAELAVGRGELADGGVAGPVARRVGVPAGWEGAEPVEGCGAGLGVASEGVVRGAGADAAVAVVRCTGVAAAGVRRTGGVSLLAAVSWCAGTGVLPGACAARCTWGAVGSGTEKLAVLGVPARPVVAVP